MSERMLMLRVVLAGVVMLAANVVVAQHAACESSPRIVIGSVLLLAGCR